MAQLLDLVGRPPSMPDDMRAEIEQAARVAWQEKVHTHAAERRSWRSWPLAAAAAVILAVGLSLFWSRQPSVTEPTALAAMPVAVVEGLIRSASLTAGDAADSLQVGSEVPAGATLETGSEGLLSLHLVGGATARLDAQSRLTIESPSVLALHAGAVYLDSGPGFDQPAFEVVTPFGIARDIGTQFEVRLLDNGLRILVREGEVRLEHDRDDHSATAGTALTVGTDGAIETDTVPSYGADWEWLLPVAPAFELEGKTVGEFLAWVSRETGWRLRYADPVLEREVETSVAYGSIAGQRPDQALDLVLPTSGLGFRVEAGTLHVTRIDSSDAGSPDANS